MSEQQIENDKKLVRRAHTDQSGTGQALRRSIAFEMAELRVAGQSWFWSESLLDFVRVEEARSEP